MIRFADGGIRTEEEKLARVCAEIQRYLKKRFGEDAGICSPMKCESPRTPNIYFRAWKGAPQEYMSYEQALELLEALQHLWV